MANPVSVFFSYSHKDEELRDQLAAHLSSMERQSIIRTWHDREITAGTEWMGAVNRYLESADLVLLLISANFLASDYCYDVELKHAIERHRQGLAKVIPVILKPVDWKSMPFGSLQALPRNGQPVTTWKNRDEAFLDVAQGIRAAVLGKQTTDFIQEDSSFRMPKQNTRDFEEIAPDDWLSSPKKSALGRFFSSIFEDK